jgi:hypothetical protein
MGAHFSILFFIQVLLNFIHITVEQLTTESNQ